MDAAYGYALQKVDAESIVGHYSIDYTKRGDVLWMPCPFHNETNPSMTVNTVNKYFRCWGCNEHGNIFTFIRKMELQTNSRELSYKESVVLGCKFCGVEIDLGEVRRYAEAFRNDITDLASVCSTDDEYVQPVFSESVLDKFRRKKNNYFLNRGFKQSTLDYLEMGFFTGDPRNVMNNRCVFPIRNESGKLIGWTGRTVLIGVEPKWLHAPKGEFKKYYSLFNIDKALDSICNTRTVNVVESVANVARLIESGKLNTVATLGATISPYQFRMLSGRADKIVFWYDWDKGGFDGIKLALSYASDHDGIFVAVTDYGINENGKALDLGDVTYNEVNSTKIITAYEFMRYLEGRMVRDMRSEFENDYKIELPDGNVVRCANELKQDSDIPQLLPDDVVFLQNIDNLFGVKRITVYSE